MPISSEGHAVPELFHAGSKVASLPVAAEDQTRFDTNGEDNMFMRPDDSAFAPCPQRQAARPLERVEIDSWRINLAALIAASGLSLSAEERRIFGFDGSKNPWYLTVANCTTTRCILAMRLSQTPTAALNTQIMDMIRRDKGPWADTVGALSTWHMYGLPEKLVTDCGTECVSVEARAAAHESGITLEHAPAGFPEMRTRIERSVMTLGLNLQSRLSGRSLSNMIKKDNHDLARTVLTPDDLCTALIRWVVDIYHRQPHAALDGESPAQCWDRLTAQYGVAVAPDMARLPFAFVAHSLPATSCSQTLKGAPSCRRSRTSKTTAMPCGGPDS